MEIIIGSEIRIRGASPAIQRWSRENLILPNPEYKNRKRMGLWTGHTPEHLWLYRTEGSDLIVPTGCGKEIRRFLSAQDRIRIDLADNGRMEYPGAVPLYDYQELAVQANTWEVRHGGFSGRTARQFVDYLSAQAEQA